MPWSDWQPAPLWDEPASYAAAITASLGGVAKAYPHLADRPVPDRNDILAAAFDDAFGLDNVNRSLTVDGSGANPGSVSAVDAANYGDGLLDPFGDAYDGGDYSLAQRIYYLPVPGWAATRHVGFSPGVIRDGVEGVDYAVIPGVDPDNPDQYVQWGGDASSAIAWVGRFEGSASGSAPGGWSLAFDPALPAYVEWDGNPGSVPWSRAQRDAPDAMSFLSGGAEAFSYDFVHDVSPTLALALGSLLPRAPLTGSSPDAAAWDVRGSFTQLSLRLLMPTWRYWIPGPLPLRQWPRDDNLALGVGRWQRGTSRQDSIRWAGYL